MTPDSLAGFARSRTVLPATVALARLMAAGPISITAGDAEAEGLRLLDGVGLALADGESDGLADDEGLVASGLKATRNACFDTWLAP